jgi:hypothetical protein
VLCCAVLCCAVLCCLALTQIHTLRPTPILISKATQHFKCNLHHISLFTVTGELGAADPARVTVMLPSSKLSKAAVSARTKAGAGTGGGVAGEKVISNAGVRAEKQTAHGRENPSPWGLTAETMGMVILEEHLVPELRSTAQAHDRTCFAIQDILKDLSKHSDVTVPSDVQKKEDDVLDDALFGDESSISIEGSRAGSGKASLKGSNTMPAFLHSSLTEHQILHITEPFWITNYTMRPLEQIFESPIYRSDVGFALWLGRWARKLGDDIVFFLMTPFYRGHL